MSALRDSDFPNFLRRGLADAIGLLVYGGNEAGVGAAVDRVVAAFKEATIRRLDASQVKEDGALLDEAFRSLSLLGDRELVIVDGADDAVGKLAGSVISAAETGNFVLLVAGALSKSSSLRKQAEEAAKFYVLPVYDARPEDVLNQADALLRQSGLKFDGEARELFHSLVGNEPALALREAEKLTLYAHGQQSIFVADVEACCGDQAAGDIDGLTDAVLRGDFHTTDQIFARLGESEQRSVFPLFSLHLTKLQNLRADFERSGSLEGALRGAKPPIFFMRKAAFSEQVRTLPLATLMTMQQRLEDATFQQRSLSGVSGAISLRTLFSLGDLARRERA